VKFLYKMFVAKKGALLADDMGLGKTVQTIAFVCAIKRGQAASHASFFAPRRGKRDAPGGVPHPLLQPLTKSPIMIICPASVLHHWHGEFYRWARLRVFICHGRSKDSTLVAICWPKGGLTCCQVYWKRRLKTNWMLCSLVMTL